ncbi:Uncharacterised protein [Vibrio cholerae]|uniref:Uncharacterized protein n=1 Tax=Vibrio cholerae TaxID=666 RepID=A0A655ZJF4_VIBCL|nr:Uncharacterised protein [Vibrio cholerae]CSC24809.1 Uncharacterised protein [Vibrio cholerae]CSC42472.1 Uncharacterised protein [Vibrio cholerae]CSC70429.1 Uncharacterised protein [Vibrio cholerae]CSC91140.1 Uncharacterised protein [Vibrio cholerae]
MNAMFMHGTHCTERHIIVTGKNSRHGNALLQQLLHCLITTKQRVIPFNDQGRAQLYPLLM